MPHFFDCKNNYNEPLRLNEKELENPILVILSFYADNSMSDIREFLYALLHSGLTTDSGPFKNAEGRDRLLILHWSLERLVEASFMLARARSSGIEECDHF